MEMNFIGPATIFETFSDALMAILLGTSSPKIRVRNMTSMTIMVWASAEAADAAIPAFCRRAENSAAILFPEKIPVRMPISVMPTCTADRNLSGS